MIESLDVTITRAYILNASILYHIRVAQKGPNGAIWHVRRSFANFLTLKEKTQRLLEENIDDSGQENQHLCPLLPIMYHSFSFSSRALCCVKDTQHRALSVCQLKRRRSLLFSKRMTRLNQLIYELISFLSYLRENQYISMYFALKNHMTTFFDCPNESVNHHMKQNAITCSSSLLWLEKVTPLEHELKQKHTTSSQHQHQHQHHTKSQNKSQKKLVQLVQADSRDVPNTARKRSIQDGKRPFFLLERHEKQFHQETKAQAWAARIEIAGLQVQAQQKAQAHTETQVNDPYYMSFYPQHAILTSRKKYESTAYEPTPLRSKESI